MQNKGLVLSLADVQALRKAGFTPKGTLLEGAPQGFADGGLAGVNQDFNSREDVQQAGAAFNALNNKLAQDYITQFGQPTDEASSAALNTFVSSGLKNSPEVAELERLKALYGNTTGTTDAGDVSSARARELILAGDVAGGMEMLKANVGMEDTSLKSADALQYFKTTGDQAGTEQILKSSVGLEEDAAGNDPDDVWRIDLPERIMPIEDTTPLTPELTQRERLLGAEGLKAYNEAQARLASDVTVPDTGPAAPVFTAPTPESILAGVTEPTQPTFEDVDGTTAQQATAEEVTAPEKPDLAKAEAVLSSDAVKEYLAEVRAAEGEITANNLVTAAIQDPASLKQLELQAAQIAEARRVEDVGRREVEAGEMISGPAVEQERVEELTAKIKAEEAQPSELATIQGQLAKLTADFDVKNPPAWAAASLRNATAQLAARGLGASSMAGQAIIQATFEAATPIAAADAATVAQFEQMNLSNRQQATMLAAQQRAQFLGQEFDQAFQAKVANASKITEIANMNFNADVQIALENARLAQSVDIANLNARNAKVLSDAAAMSNMELANLNNRQQTAVANARAFLDMDIANLNNEQQTTVLKAQSVVNSMLSDQAAENAAINLNTTNENELNRFFAQLESNTAQFNAAQKNAIAQSNVSEVNAMVKFKQEQKNALKIAYDRNQTAISQSRISANASIETTRMSAEASVFGAETSAAATRAAAAVRAEADRDIAAAANEARVTLSEMEQAFQLESDILAYNYDTMTSNADKAFELIKLDLAGEIALEAAQYEIDAADDAATKKSIADILVEFVSQI